MVHVVIDRYFSLFLKGFDDFSYAVVSGHFEFPLLKDCQRFDAISTSTLNLEIYKFWDW